MEKKRGVYCDHCQKVVIVEDVSKPAVKIMWLDQALNEDKTIFKFEFTLCPSCREELLFSYFLKNIKK